MFVKRHICSQMHEFGFFMTFELYRHTTAHVLLLNKYSKKTIVSIPRLIIASKNSRLASVVEPCILLYIICKTMSESWFVSFPLHNVLILYVLY